jgi:hypothetical protein
MVTAKARGYIARKIARNIDEGKSAKEAQAIAFSQARAKGYKIPEPPGIRAAERGR